MENVDCKLTTEKQANRLTGFTQSTLFLAMLVGIVTTLAFMRVLDADFVMWDDDLYIYENSTLGTLSLENLRLIFNDTTASSSWYTPLGGLRWSITCQFWKLNPFGYHLGNLLFHVADAILIFVVLRKLLTLGFRKQGDTEPWDVGICAAIGTLLWSLHPLRVEVVAWAASLYGQALFFLLISLLCYLKANEEGLSKWQHRTQLVISVISFAASLLSQPVVVGFLVVFFILDIYPLRRIGWQQGFWKSAGARRAILEKLPFIGIALAIALVNAVIQIYSSKIGHKAVGLSGFGPFARIMQAMYIWAYYMWRPWYPINLSPAYTALVSFNPLSVVFIGSALLVIGVIALFIFLRHRWPLGLALGVCYFVLLIPVLGILEHPHFANDRYSLIVSIVWSILLAALLARPKTKTLFRNITLVLSIIVIAILGSLTFRQIRVWKNSVGLFGYMINTLGEHPYRSDIYWRMGIFLGKQDQDNKAIEYLEQAIKIDPKHVKAYNFIGIVYGKTGKLAESVKALKSAIRIDPNFSDAHCNLGVTYERLGNYQEAIESYKEAIRLQPDFAEAHLNLGYTYMHIGNKWAAMEEYKVLKELKADLAKRLLIVINK